jgi:hypothetical protein
MSPETRENIEELLIQADLRVRSLPTADQSHVEPIRAALALLREDDGWRPLDTLPPDIRHWLGTNADGWCDHGPDSIELCVGQPDPELGVLCQNSANYIRPGYITHWRPLPTPPKGTEG